jgi:hypothetical protein
MEPRSGTISEGRELGLSLLRGSHDDTPIQGISIQIKTDIQRGNWIVYSAPVFMSVMSSKFLDTFE